MKEITITGLRRLKGKGDVKMCIKGDQISVFNPHGY